MKNMIFPAIMLARTCRAFVLPVSGVVFQHHSLKLQLDRARLGTIRSFASARAAGVRMGIYDEISTSMKEAMKSGEKEKLSALRNIRAAFLTETKAGGGTGSLTDEKCLIILKKLAKMRTESIEMYVNGGRDELAEKERIELALIDQYLPALAEEATTRQWVEAAVASTGAKGPSDIGKVMGVLMKAHRDEMDGKLAQRIVQEVLKKAVTAA